MQTSDAPTLSLKDVENIVASRLEGIKFPNIVPPTNIPDISFSLDGATDEEIDDYVVAQYKDLPDGFYQIGDPKTMNMSTGRGGVILYKKALYKEFRNALRVRK